MDGDRRPGRVTVLRAVGFAAAIAVVTAGLYFGAVAQSGDDSMGTAIIALLVSCGLVVFAARGAPRA